MQHPPSAIGVKKMTTTHDKKQFGRSFDILVAEDSTTQAEHLARLLGQEPGCRVRIAADGEAALRAARAVQPDLVISDIAMPGMDGYALCRALKADSLLSTVPVLLLTRLVDLQDIVRSLEAGADGFVRKPYDGALLRHRVRRILDSRDAADPARALDAMADERREIHALLVATHDEALRLNDELAAQRAELARQYANAEALVARQTAALRSERNRLAAIVETAGTLVLITDPDGRILTFNRACEEALGWRAEQALDRRCWDVVRGAGDPDAIRHLFEGLANNLPPQRLRGEWLTPDGRTRSIVWTHTLLRREDDSVEFILATGVDVTELRGAEQRLHYASNYDAVTGLPNRDLLREHLRRMKAQAQGDGRILGFMLLRFARMPLIREALGPVAEQGLLREAAARLRNVGAHDLVGRFSEGAFALVLVRADADELATSARRLLAALGAPYVHEQEEFHLEPCIGIATYPSDGVAYETLARDAEAALRQAADGVGQRYAFYRPELNRDANDRFKLENALRRAIERRELEVHYQPQIAIEGGAIAGVEALLRWRHPERGLVPPSDFIPLAEESALILEIGEWVLRQVCAQMHAWHHAGLPIVPVAVNLSAHQFTEQILGTVRSVLDDCTLEPGLLELELTESASMADADKSVALLAQLKGLGIRLAIDDFGTGYSNLNYLKRFPVDRLKLDRSFVRDLENDPDDLAIARAVIAMAHGLRLSVVAEGVETAGQLALLAGLGCDLAQGWLFSRAVPAEEFAALLAAGQGPPAGSGHVPM
jgi:PAS domain S-box-containing protein/diguanylate cyclase (GGDEF)-like protein